MLAARASRFVAATAPSSTLGFRRHHVKSQSCSISAMTQLLREYTSEDDLRDAIAFCNKRPQHLLIGHSAKYQLEKAFPETYLRLFSNHGEPKFWFACKRNQFIREMNIITMVDGIQFNESEFEPLFNEFLAKTGALSPKRSIGFLADSPITDFEYPCRMFYMNKEQQERVKYFQPSIPDGYEISVLEPENDAELVTSTWKHAEPGELAMTRNLPSVCIRYNGWPVSFEMCDHIGDMNHLFTLTEHRGKGLGSAVENLLAQKLIDFGTTPLKFVELGNTLATASTERSPLWTSMTRNGENGYVVYQIVDFVD